MKHSLILFILTLFISGCTKSDPYIPCSGDDCFYFVCKVDGEKWVPSCEGDGIFGCYATDVQYYRYTGTNNIYIYIKNDKGDSAFKIYALNISDRNISYSIHRPGKTFTSYIDRVNTNSCSSYKIDTTLNNYILLNEIDTVNYIIGGEFEFMGQDSCGKVVNVTEGNFRLRYRF